jgi:hypothetical protein
MTPPACDTCKWWSEYLARVVDGGVIDAEDRGQLNLFNNECEGLCGV